MKKAIKSIVVSMMIASMVIPVFAVPVGNNVEYIPPSRNLGIGVIDPAAKLEVNGQVMITEGNPGLGKVLTSDAFGLATWEPATVLGSNVSGTVSKATNATNITNGTIINSTFTGGIINGATLTNVVISSASHNHSQLVNPSNSSVALTVDGGSDVGIGTTNPLTDLHVVSDTINGGVMVGSTVTGKYPILRGPVSTAFGIPNEDSFRIGVDNSFVGTNLDYLVFDKTDGNEVDPDGGIVFTNTGSDNVQEVSLLIKGNGRIGVGEKNPNSLLHMTGDNATLTAQNTNEGAWSEFRTAGVNSSGDLVKKWSVGSTGDTRPTANGGQDKFYIYQYTNASDVDVNAYRMVITPEGNTGFGVNSPVEKLEVAGNVKAYNFIGNGAGLTGISVSNVANADTANFADFATSAGTATTSDTATLAGTATNVTGGTVNNVMITNAQLTGQITGGTLNGTNLINVNIADPNDPWILVHSEDFQSGVTGWTNNTTTSCAGHRILGGFGVAGKNTNLQKQFDLSAYPHSHVRVNFNYYSLDTWDDHAAIAKIDGFPAWVENRIHFATQGRDVFPNCGSGGLSSYSDRIIQGTAYTEHSSNTLQLGFSSTLDEALNNESFGIDNVEIWVKRSGVTPSLPTPPGPSDNAGCAADGYYHVTDSEQSAGSHLKGYGTGPSTADFSKCDKVQFDEGGHSVTRTWSFTNPPRSGLVTFYIKRRRSSPAHGATEWFNTSNISVSPNYYEIAENNADVTFSCYYNATSQTYGCSVTKVVL